MGLQFLPALTRLPGVALLLSSMAIIEKPQCEPGKLILLRHGQSDWNVENRFTGWEDTAACLTEVGAEQAREASQLLLQESGLPPIDLCYCSVLERSVRSGQIVLEQMGAAGRPVPELRSRWRLNERHYGSLQGLDKADAMRTLGREELNEWRSSWAGAPPPMDAEHPYYSREPTRLAKLLEVAMSQEGAEPLTSADVPLTESLADVVTRVQPLWDEELLPALMSGKTILLVGHKNGLRALARIIQPDNIGEDSLSSLSMPNSIPVVYEFDEDGKPLKEIEGNCYVPPLYAHYLGDQCLVFNALDVNHDGTLAADELGELDVCSALIDDDVFDEIRNDPGSAAEIRSACGEALLEEVDGNGDGGVDFNEFMTWESARRAATRDAPRNNRISDI